jgi:hypothetical protein
MRKVEVIYSGMYNNEIALVSRRGVIYKVPLNALQVNSIWNYIYYIFESYLTAENMLID